MDIETLDIETSQGVPLRAVYVHAEGDEQATVRFYDRRYNFTDHGQFITSYWASTIVNKPVGGLVLQGGVPDWYIDTRAMFGVWVWVMNLTGSWPGCEVKS